MLDRLEDIDRAHGWLQKLRPLPAAVNEELRHRYTVRLTHHSTAIEGNTLTQSETEVVIEQGITIGGKSVVEHLEVIGHRDALDYVIGLADRREPLGERQIREVHSLVMRGQDDADAGRYRNLDVKAAGTEHVYPSHWQLPQLMADYAAWLSEPAQLHPVYRASEAHLRFVTTHPFRDGNGRVGRLLLNLLLIRDGFPIAVIPVSKRVEYIDALVAAQSGQGRDELDALVGDAVLESLGDTLSVSVSSEEVQHSHASTCSEIRDWLRARTNRASA